MPNWVPLDDTSSQIGYSGSWTTLKGSSRQWEAGVHSTTQTGASAVLRFKGVGVAFRGTVPSGSGSQVFEYKIDDGAAIRKSTAQRSSDEYAVELVRVVDLPEAIHTITLTNLGGAPFQVDMFEYWPGTGDPNPAPLLPLPPPTTTTRPLPPPTTRPPPPPPTTQPTPEPTRDPTQVQPPDPTISERTTAVIPSDTRVITSPTTASTPDSEGVEGSFGSSESPITPSSGSSPGPRTILSTDANGHVINKIIPMATERTVTSTDANGQVSTVTVVEAAASGSSPSLGAIIGIVVGGVIALLALLIFLLLCRRRRKAKNARYAADTRQEAFGYSEGQPAYAATHSSADLISPFREDSPGHTPTSSAPFWRKETYPLSDQRPPLSAVSGGGLSAVTGSGLSYTGENAVVASSDPPPAYRAPTHTLTEDTLTTASGMYGSEKPSER